MKMKTLDVVNIEGKKVDDIKLNEKVFDGFINHPLIHQAIVMYQANQRLGSASTKTRAQVRGGGKKPWRQKGTGRARAGSIRSPLWRGGGVTFGPRPRDYHYRIPKKALKGALRSVINDKINDNNIIVIDKFEVSTHKTKDFISILKKFKIKSNTEKVLVIAKTFDKKALMASDNIKKVTLISSKDVNAHNVILADKLLVEKKAFSDIEKRISG